MSNIIIQVNGSSSGDGFLIAPNSGRTFSVPLQLSTSDGSTVSATIDATPNAAGVALPAGPVSIGPVASTISIQAAAQSAARGDTVINVRVGGATTSFSLTAIGAPVIWFRGRFEARFATDGDYYNNRRGTDGGIPGSDPSLGPGWTWALEGEPDFVPADSVPTTITKPVGRVVRFNKPAALRPFVAPVATTVIQIQGATTTGTEVFTSGDPMIGATANLGPNTYLASNMPQNPADPAPAESNQAGFEAMALFECHIDGFFSGASAAAADRPTASGFNSPLDAAEKAIPQFIDPITGTPTTFIDQATFEQRRLQVLQGAFSALSPAQQTGTPAGRNLNTRITHIQGSTTLPAGWDGYEEYRGIVNAGVTFQPVQSSVLDYLKGFATFNYFAKLFTFHNDELCGYVSGSLSAQTASSAGPSAITAAPAAQTQPRLVRHGGTPSLSSHRGSIP
jgi:hypothetical protein